MQNIIDHPLTKQIAIYTVLTTILIAVIMSIYIYLHPTQWLDVKFSGELQEHSFTLLTKLMQLVSLPGNSAIGVATVLAASLVFWKIKHKRAAWCFLLVLVADLLSYIIKFVVNRPRPSQEIVSIAGRKLAEPGFPSTHVVHYVVYFGFLAFVVMLLPKFKPLLRYGIVGFCLFMIIAVSVSRIYLGAHWFSDVIAGYLFGLIFLAGIISIYLQKNSEPGGGVNNDSSSNLSH